MGLAVRLLYPASSTAAVAPDKDDELCAGEDGVVETKHLPSVCSQTNLRDKDRVMVSDISDRADCYLMWEVDKRDVTSERKLIFMIALTLLKRVLEGISGEE